MEEEGVQKRIWILWVTPGVLARARSTGSPNRDPDGRFLLSLGLWGPGRLLRDVQGLRMKKIGIGDLGLASLLDSGKLTWCGSRVAIIGLSWGLAWPSRAPSGSVK